MSRRKRKLTAAEKAEKKRRRKEYMTIFVRGKQKRIRRPPTIEGIDLEEFILQNADPIWLHQNELWEYMELPEGQARFDNKIPQHSASRDGQLNCDKDDKIPF